MAGVRATLGLTSALKLKNSRYLLIFNTLKLAQSLQPPMLGNRSFINY
jgi:hypothetical protein